MMMMMMTQKRKAVDQVNHDFSDFSLSSPATKIRRLDHVELAPIIEEDEVLLHEEDEQTIAAAAAAVREGEIENEERAIVLFNPNNTLSHSSPTFSLTPHILSTLKGQSHLLSKHSNLFNNSSFHQQDKDATLEDDDDISNQCLAVVPWVQSHLSPAPNSSETMMMEADLENQQEIASMDIEQEYNDGYAAATSGNEQRPATEFGGPSVGFHQWQQQHCMVPSQLPPHTAAAAPAPTPVVWFN